MKYCTKKQSFPLRISEELVTFTEEILNGKLHFLCIFKYCLITTMNYFRVAEDRHYCYNTVEYSFGGGSCFCLLVRKACVFQTLLNIYDGVFMKIVDVF